MKRACKGLRAIFEPYTGVELSEILSASLPEKVFPSGRVYATNWLLFLPVLLSAAGIGFAQQANNKSKQSAAEAAPAPIPAEAAAKQNPVKVTPKGVGSKKVVRLSLRHVPWKRWRWQRRSCRTNETELEELA
jgi:hypothetical protein